MARSVLGRINRKIEKKLGRDGHRAAVLIASILGGSAIAAPAYFLSQGDTIGPAPDYGSAKVAPCPQGFTKNKGPIHNAALRRGSIGLGDGAFAVSVMLDSATEALAGSLPKNPDGEALTWFKPAATGIRAARMAAARTVFYTKSSSFDRDHMQFDIDRPPVTPGANPFRPTPETMLDDYSEQFCASGSKVFLSPRAERAIVEMAQAGINTQGIHQATHGGFPQGSLR